MRINIVKHVLYFSLVNVKRVMKVEGFTTVKRFDTMYKFVKGKISRSFFFLFFCFFSTINLGAIFVTLNATIK